MVEPCTSIQNGTVERACRIIEQMTHCLLVAVRVLPPIGTEAMSYAANFINKLSVSGYGGAVLCQFWCSTPTLGFPPGLFLCVWMCHI